MAIDLNSAGGSLHDEVLLILLNGAMKRGAEVRKHLTSKLVESAGEVDEAIQASNQATAEAQRGIGESLRLSHVSGDDDDQPATRGDIRAVAQAAKRVKS